MRGARVATAEPDEERAVGGQTGGDDGEGGLDDGVEEGHEDGGGDVGHGQQGDRADAADAGDEDAGIRPGVRLIFFVAGGERWNGGTWR